VQRGWTIGGALVLGWGLFALLGQGVAQTPPRLLPTFDLVTPLPALPSSVTRTGVGLAPPVALGTPAHGRPAAEAFARTAFQPEPEPPTPTLPEPDPPTPTQPQNRFPPPPPPPPARENGGPLPIQVSLVGPTTATRGATLALQVRVVHQGDRPITDGIVRITLPPALRHPGGGEIEADLGDLKPGDVRLLPLDLGAEQTGRWTVGLGVRTPDGRESRSEQLLTVNGAALNLRLEGPLTTPAGREFDLQAVLVNADTTPARRVRVQLTIPDGLEVAAIEDDGRFDAVSRTTTWELAQLPAGSGAAVGIKLRPARTGAFSLEALAETREAPASPARTTLLFRVEGAADLALRASCVADQLAINEETTCVLRLANQGAAPGPNVRLAARLPDGLQAVRAEGPTQVRLQGQQVVFEPIAQLAPGGEAVYRLTVRGLQPGIWDVTIWIGADHLSQPMQERVVVPVAGNPGSLGGP
jgi:hypothetical protein